MSAPRRPVRAARAVVALYAATGLALLRTFAAAQPVVSELAIVVGLMVTVVGGAMLLRTMDDDGRCGAGAAELCAQEAQRPPNEPRTGDYVRPAP